MTYKIKRAGTDNDASAGDLDLNGDSIQIRSDRRKPAVVSGNGIDRVFDVGPLTPVKATFIRLKITGGAPGNDDGGGVNVTAGKAKLVQSTVSGNTTSSFGGGINLGGGDGVLVQSTVSGNSADNAGGIAAHAPTSALHATNSTVANNSATGTGGGIDVFSGSRAVLHSITVVRNHANTGGMGQDGGGLYNSASTTVRNSLIALNTVAPVNGGTGPNCFGTFTSAGRNLFSDLSGCSGFATPPNIVQADPHIGGLKANGGPTKTVALLQGSKAINHAGPSPARDQRNFQRHNPDIGAFER